MNGLKKSLNILIGIISTISFGYFVFYLLDTSKIIHNAFLHEKIISIYPVMFALLVTLICYEILFILPARRGYSKYGERKVLMDFNQFNKNHPNRREDEVFLCNANYAEYVNLKWQTKRNGICAYTIIDEPNKKGVFIDRNQEIFPVFVKIKEVKELEDGKERLKDMLP